MKKAQIKMFETVGVLVVFFFLIMIGMMFFARESGIQHQEDLEKSFDLRTMDVIQVANNLPELQCTNDNVGLDNCYDILKLESFQGETFYYNILYFSRINITQIYPESESSWEIYSNVPRDFTSKSQTKIPISLYNSSSRSYYAGILTVEVFQ